MIIEVRPIIEKVGLKRKSRELRFGLRLRKTHKVPHLTLLYDFRPNNMAPQELAEIVKTTAAKYGRLRYRYNGYEIKNGSNGYVLTFKIEPSLELRKFRYELYRNLKPYINEDPRTTNFNSKTEEDYWFHAAISFHMNSSEARRAEDFIDGIENNSFTSKLSSFLFGSKSTVKRSLSPINHSIMDSEAIRIPIIMKQKIAYEYDTLLGRVLNRREALSSYYQRQTLSKYRELENLEIKTAMHKAKPTTWLISDTHFYHEPIIGFTSRPFYDIREMNDILLSNWNNVISPKDTVYFLGDLALGRERDPPKRAKPELTHMWQERLNGKKIFINGNHDPLVFGEYWKDIGEYEGIRFLLIHRPTGAEDDWPEAQKRELDSLMANSDRENVWIIHGHTHNSDLVNYPFINYKKRTVNVSIELIRYKPIELAKIIGLIQQEKKENLLYLPQSTSIL